jgi:hypothetical protein
MNHQLDMFEHPDTATESFIRCPTCQGTVWRHVRYKTPELIKIACVGCESRNTN